jgi:hypothetical protein
MQIRSFEIQNFKDCNKFDLRIAGPSTQSSARTIPVRAAFYMRSIWLDSR